MKKQFLISSFLVLLLAFAFTAYSQTARLQVIHNAADPAAAAVDIYLNGNLLLDDFAFRAATPFIDAPANTPLEIGVAPGTSSSAADILATIPVTLTAGETYVAIANGVLDPSAFAPNPDGKDTGFQLLVKTPAREAAVAPDMVDFFALHGSTDAPTVDVIARGVATLVDNAPYGAMTDYLSVPAAKYLLDVTPGDDNSVIVGTFEADLSGLGGGAATVFASGFLTPAANQNGPAFGLFAALPTGDVLELPAVTTARLQVIHNAADPAAFRVDVYVNGGLLLDDFKFRTATPFIDAPANTPLEIGVAPETSSSAADILATIPVTLKAGETYVAIANGVLDPTGFAPNPDGKDTGFQLFVKEMARETTADAKSVDLFVFHGATDAPMVDIAVRDLGTIVDDAPYGAMTDYLNVPLGRFNLDLAVSSDPNTVIGSFAGGFWQSSGGTGAVVFASGFLAPDTNQNGRGFGIYAALSSGQVVRFSPLETARLQVIHNAADPAAEIVDVYLNGGLLLDDFAFRTATPFIDAPANTPLDIGIAPSTSTSVDDAIAHIEVSLLGGATYVAVANGVIGSGFAANPDGLDIAFTLLADRDVREKAQWVKFVELVVLHGATDAPAVDVLARGTNEPLPPKFDDPIVDNLAYGQFTDLLRLWPRAYTLDITPGSDNSVVVASYDVNLEGLAGISAVVFASGFLSPPDNNNGPAFGLYAALPTGDVVAFPTAPPAQGALASTMATSIDGSAQAPVEYSLSQNYPNPFNPTTTISFSLREATDVSLRVFDLMGREVATLVNGKMTSGQHQVVFDASSLASGKYFYQIEAGSFKAVKSLTLIK